MATSKTGGKNAQGAGGAGKRSGSAGGSAGGAKGGAAGAGDGRTTAPAATTGEAGAGTGGAGGAGKAATGGARPKAGSAAASARGKANGKSKADGTAAGAARKTAAGAGARGRSGEGKLEKDLREFVQAHPGGWGHNEWIGLVNLLRDRGHDTSDTDAIGMALERERLKLVLERVPGLGPQRVNTIADRYPRLWNLMQANAEEIATVTNLPKAVAEKVRDAVH